MQNKDEFFGSFNAAHSHLEIALSQLHKYWREGEGLLAEHDIEEVREKLKNVSAITSDIRAVVNLFNKINEEKKILCKSTTNMELAG